MSLLKSPGKYEREAMVRRMDELLQRHSDGELSPDEGKELDRLIERLGAESDKMRHVTRFVTPGT